MKLLEQIAQENGFRYEKIDASEFEDGVGACVGDNWIKNSGTTRAVWYTTPQMLEELGLPKLQVKTADLDISVGIEGAKRAAIDWLNQQNAKWYIIDKCKKSYGGSAISLCLLYGVE